MKRKNKLGIILVALTLWLTMGITDLGLVRDFERPVFCLLVNGADDGGSGTYVGLGYSFEIWGNFMPEDELPGVTYYRYKIFGLDICSGIRD